MSEIRISIARFWHESNSFSCSLTQITDFESYQEGTLIGPKVLANLQHRNEMAGFVEVLKGCSGIQIVPLLSAGALPSGLLAEDTVRYFEDILRGELRRAGRLDGICLALHGATSSTTVPDFDGHFLKIVRQEVGPDIPIICALDPHAIVTTQMLELCDAVFAYRTHPHVDLVETGMLAARTLMDQIRGKIKPAVSYQRIPLLFPPPDEGTHTGPMKELFDTFIEWDRIDGVIGCSLCFSYAWQDVAEQGCVAIAVTDDDPALGDRLARELAEQVWSVRERLLPESMLSPEDAVRQAAASPGCPIVITDSADTVGAGSPGDTADLLGVLLDLRGEVDGLILIHIPDPEAVAAVGALEPGDGVTVDVGGKWDTRFSRPPVTVTGRVVRVTDGVISDDGRFGTELFVDAGSAALLAVDNVRLVLTERRVLGPQPSLFRKVGLEPFEAKIVALKTGVGFKATYGHVAKTVFRADCPGAASYNLLNYQYKNATRPLYPLDPDMNWRAI